MTPDSTATSNTSERSGPARQGDKSDDMRDADTANGENPDDDSDPPSPATRRAEGQDVHLTGERQARENRENDPPA